jgi:hypothetical protein
MTFFQYPERQEIDREGRYQVEGLTQVEYHASKLVRLLPRHMIERTRDLFQLTGIDPDDPVLVITREFIELRLPAAEWPHPNIPAPSSRFWKRVEWEGLDDDTAVTRLVDEARQARRSEITACRFCGRPSAPESLTDGACHDCAAEHLGIIH